ncbi:methionyl-tRNA formyltransferase [Patescibacteria group bacterium]|nr:methionyl-tRNA formyltransferase [Patescibacteria group bacterium]
MKSINFVYFGTPEFSVIILEELKQAGYLPSLIVTSPDRPVGRKHIVTPPPVKEWAKLHHIEYWQPEHPRDIEKELLKRKDDLFIVASYGYILPQSVLDIPRYGVLNVHTSLLPKYRGAAPIESVILNGEETTGSTIMRMTLGMDEGPIITQSQFDIEADITKPELFEMLAHDGGKLLASILPDYLRGKCSPIEQNHSEATYCGKIQKSDGDITHDTDIVRWRKYRAYYGWPGVFVFDNGTRLKITNARYENDTFVIEKVIPEGKNEMDYEQYQNNHKNKNT